MWLIFALLLTLATPAWAGQLDATWTAPTTFSDGSPLTGSLTYRVYWQLFGNTPCPGTQFIVTNPDTTSAHLANLTQGMTYSVQVTANNAAGESACSLMASAPANADGPLPLGSALQIMFAASAPPPTGTVNFGDTTIETTAATSLGGVLWAQPATLAQAATLHTLSIYVATPGGRVQLGIYDATGVNGGPGQSLTITPAVTPVAGWNTVSVPRPIPLAAGTYWLAFVVDNNGSVYRKSTAGSGRQSFTFSMQTPFPSSSTVPGTFSMYGTVTTP